MGTHEQYKAPWLIYFCTAPGYGCWVVCHNQTGVIRRRCNDLAEAHEYCAAYGLDYDVAP